MGVLHDPSDGNYQLFSHAKSALQSAMDTIISPPDPCQPENSLDMLSTAALSPDWIFSDYLGLGVDSWYVRLKINGLTMQWLISKQDRSSRSRVFHEDGR